MAETNHPDTLILMDEARIERTIRRIAFQILEYYPEADDLVFLGIDSRGYAVSKSLAEIVSKAASVNIECHPIYPSRPEIPSKNHVEGKNVILIDDVIFSGKTVIKSLKKIFEAGEPEAIQLAVLVDRGHRQFPVYPEFTGTRYPTKLREHVSVQFDETNQAFRVILDRNN